MCAGYRKINRSLPRYYVVRCKCSQPYVLGRAVENGLPRDVNSFLAIWKQRTRDHTRAPLIKVKREREGGNERKSEKRERERRSEGVRGNDGEGRLCYVSSMIFPRSLRNSTLSLFLSHLQRQWLPLQFSVRSDKYCALWLVIIQMARLLLNADSSARITTREWLVARLQQRGGKKRKRFFDAVFAAAYCWYLKFMYTHTPVIFGHAISRSIFHINSISLRASDAP